jgi:hypothetical protein
MGFYREYGYSAEVEGFFVVDGERIRLAKTNGATFVLVEPRAIAPGTSGELLIIVDGQKDSKRVTLPDGVLPGQTLARYALEAPF